jgi:phosphate transport system substrate-binding protein
MYNSIDSTVVSGEEEAYHIDKVTFHKGEVGTVFEGKSQFNLTIPELLRKQAQF